MRRLSLIALFACEFACGGSSSETPPPLEPDPARLHEATAPAGETPATETPAVVPALPPSTDTDGAPNRAAPAVKGGATAPPRQPSTSTPRGTAPPMPVPELAPEPQL
jgi:hypothetical protein